MRLCNLGRVRDISSVGGNRFCSGVLHAGAEAGKQGQRMSFTPLCKQVWLSTQAITLKGAQDKPVQDILLVLPRQPSDRSLSGSKPPWGGGNREGISRRSRRAGTSESTHTIQADVLEVKAQHLGRLVQHGLNCRQVHRGLEHAHSLGTLSWEQEHPGDGVLHGDTGSDEGEGKGEMTRGMESGEPFRRNTLLVAKETGIGTCHCAIRRTCRDFADASCNTCAPHPQLSVTASVGPCWHWCWIVLSHLKLPHAPRQT